MAAGTAGVLIAPLTTLQQDGLSLLVIPTLAAALAGGFSSFPMAFVGALTIGAPIRSVLMTLPLAASRM